MGYDGDMGHAVSRLTPVFGLLAALVYNSWPLGYVLNRRVAAHGLASDFGASGQPYNWVYIGGDVFCGVLVVVAIWLLVRYVRLSSQAITACVGIGIFGIMTAVSALLSLSCVSNIRACGYQPSQTLGAHDITGAVAAAGLFVGLVYAWRARADSGKLAHWNGALLFVWSLWGLAFTLVLLPSVQRAPHFSMVSIVWEQAFIVLSGAGVAAVIYSLSTLPVKESRR